MKLFINKPMLKKHSLLALLIVNVPAWSMDSMSGMHANHMESHGKTKPAQTEHDHAEKQKPVVKKTVAIANETPSMDHSAMHMNQKMDQGAMKENNVTPMKTLAHQHTMPMNHEMGKMQGGAAPANARSSDYSQGRDFGPIHPPMMMGNDPLLSLAVNRLEWVHRNNSNQATYEIEGWWGDDWNRAVLKAEGTINNQSFAEARTELLWRKPFTTFWNTELGVRQDSGDVNNHTWLALGINGTAPYWLDLDATFYVRDQRQTALILNAEYDWRITQSWVLQPSLEMSFYGKNDLANDIGQGLSEVQSGLRLRYDINHRLMPYIGVEVSRHYGKTAKLIMAKGGQPNQTSVVAGVAFWF